MSAIPVSELVQILRAHLESLRAAGVTFIPRGEPLELRLVTPEPPEESAPEAATPLSQSLFSELPPPPPETPDGRRHALTLLATEIAGCDLCKELYSTRTQTVFGVGKIDPEVAFVGEAPGADEDRQGEPFVGRAGQLLTRIIKACGLQRSEVYIFNTLKCRPPNNRPPTPTECSNCRPYFERQFDLVNPKCVVALGGTAAKSLLRTTVGITMLRGHVYQYRDVPLICTFHPSAVLRDDTGKLRRDCWEDMKLLLRTMGRTIPEVKRGED